MTEKIDKRKIEYAIQKLDYNWKRYTFDHFVDHIEKLRKRTMVIIPLSYLKVPAICTATKFSDYIIYDSSDIMMSQHHHKLHEIGHFVLGHVEDVISCNDLQDVLRDIRAKSLFRSYSHIYDRDLGIEHEAEYFAYLVEDKISSANRLNQLTNISVPTNWQIPPFHGNFAKEES